MKTYEKVFDYDISFLDNLIVGITGFREIGIFGQ